MFKMLKFQKRPVLNLLKYSFSSERNVKPPQKSFYDILEVKPNASPHEIRENYLKLG